MGCGVSSSSTPEAAPAQSAPSWSDHKLPNHTTPVLLTGVDGGLQLLLLHPEAADPRVTVQEKPHDAVRLVTRCSFTASLVSLGSDLPPSFSYTVDDVPYSGRWFGKGGQPGKVVAMSCNGFESGDARLELGGIGERWGRLADEEDVQMLLMGGDQVYADSVWHIDELRQRSELDDPDTLKKPLSDAIVAAVEDYYFELYLRMWTVPKVAAVVSRIAAVCIWDDHDVFDGWGSYPSGMQDSPVYHQIYAIARRYFYIFQVPVAPQVELPQIASRTLRAGDIGVIVLDTRSERTRTQVLHPGDLASLGKRVGQLAQDGATHVLVAVSIPAVYVPVKLAERMYVAMPDYQNMEDDLRDQWRSEGHQEERLRLFSTLQQAAVDHGVRVSLVSGDVHLAAHGTVTCESLGPGATLNQLTSSPMGNHTPPGMLVTGLNMAGDFDEDLELAGGAKGVARLVKVGDSGKRFLAQRNFLVLDTNADGALVARWELERRDDDDVETATTIVDPFAK